MRIVVALPSRLQQLVADRLQILSAPDHEIIPVCTDTGQSLPPLHPEDGLLFIQPANRQTARQMAAAAEKAGIHYGEAALLESPLAAQHGFMLIVGGKTADLQAMSAVLDALSPQTNAWWHVGHAGSAVFLSSLVTRLSATFSSAIDLINPLPQLIQAARSHQAFGSDAAEYLAATEEEQFSSVHPDRQKALISFITDGSDSPARQIAKFICICSCPTSISTPKN